MPDRVGYKIEGLTRVVRALKALGLDVDDLKGAFSRIASEGATAAARHAPRRSGRLAGDVRGNRAQSKAVITAGRSTIRYAGVQNYGWPRRGIAASGFMQAADEEMRPKVIPILEDEINKAARRRGLDT